MNNIDLILSDAVTYIKIRKNENYKERLLDCYYTLKKSNINAQEEFEKSNLDLGAFTYEEITIFDRLKDENYSRALASYYIEIGSTYDLPKDYGDRLASWGKVKSTPHKEKYIKTYNKI